VREYESMRGRKRKIEWGVERGLYVERGAERGEIERERGRRG
jgi:hypothetical protein